MSQYEFISVSETGDAVSLTLNRPPLNVLHIPMMRELNAALEGIVQSSPAKAVLLRAQGKAFSAGVDVADHTAERVQEMMREFHRIFDLLLSITVPTIAVVDGAALGGGCEVALACDMLIASERSKFGQPEIKLGVFPPIAAALLPAQIGRQRALEFLLSGDTVTAAEAERIGMVNRVFPVEGFDNHVQAFAARFTAHSRAILALAKRAADGREYRPQQAIHGAGDLYMGEMMATHDAHEGLNAFLEKRQPVWSNR